MKTSKQIAKELNLDPQTLRARFYKYQIKGKRRGLTFFYTKEQIELISYKKSYKQSLPKYSKPNSFNDQILIIRYYFEGLPYKQIAELVNVKYSYVFNIVGNFKRNDDFLIIQSKINCLS